MFIIVLTCQNFVKCISHPISKPINAPIVHLFTNTISSTTS